ncbi:Transcriptional activator spt7 [Savitreella phatthalungensis]
MSSGPARARWINADPDFLQAIARDIAASDKAQACLSVEERALVSKAVARDDFWNDIDRIEAGHPRSSATGSNGTLKPGADDAQDDLSTLFRTRCLLYENSIESDLFKSARDFDLGLVSPYVVTRKATELQVPKTNASATGARARAADDDDDYDDDDEDEEKEDSPVKIATPHPPAPPAAPSPAPASAQSPAPASAPTLIVHTPSAVRPLASRFIDRPGSAMSQRPGSATPSMRNGHAGPSEDDAAAIENRRIEDSVLAYELNTRYHTLDYDRHAMLEQHKLEAADRQVDLESGEDGLLGGLAGGNPRFSNMNFGAANLSLKHLLAKIEASREKLAMTDNELRSLLSEVRKNRSKWANEDKIGQEELYEAAERVVLELRGYTEHSTAFLNKVTKRDVPDYYNIIKHPMDLGTLMKKLKNLEFKSKKEFADDVMLIWQNCLTYNAAPEHPLRKHALAMQRKSHQLLSMVPDVVVRDRAEVEAEEFGVDAEEANAGAESDDDKPLVAKSTRGTVGSKSSKAKKSKGSSQPPMQPVMQPPSANGHTNGDVKQEDIDQDISMMDDGHEATKTLPSSSAADDAHPPGEHNQHHNNAQNEQDDETFDETDYGFQVWRQKTKTSRANYTSERYKLFKGDTLKEDHTALTQTPQSLVDIPDALALESFSRLKETSPEDDYHSSASKNSQSDLNVKLLIREYEPSCIPPEQGRGDETAVGPVRFTPVEDVTAFEPAENGLNNKMQLASIEMKNIRHICTRLETLRLMQEPSMSAFPANYFRQRIEAELQLKYAPVQVFQEGFDCQPCGEELARALLRKSTSQLLYHAGFEDFASPALAAMTEMVGDYIRNLGKLMKVYSEAPRGTYTPEEILEHTLLESGAPDIASLEAYAKDEVVTKYDKVVGLHGRFRQYLNDFINGTVDGQGLDPNQMFDENNQDAFVSGAFGDEIGDDFFGFKELGLDKEFGLSSLSVPLRLLQGRFRPQSGVGTTGDPTTPVGNHFERRFPPITREYASKQIGLFRPFLEAKFAALEAAQEGVLPSSQAPPATLTPAATPGPVAMSISASQAASIDGTVEASVDGGAPTPAATADADDLQPPTGVGQPSENDGEDGTTAESQPDVPIATVLALVEDEDLPPRQRKPKPRLPPNGKITAAQKRPLRDPHAVSTPGSTTAATASPSKKRKKTASNATSALQATQDPELSPAATFVSSLA